MKTKTLALLLVALLAASCGAEEVKTVEDLRHAVEAYPAHAPVFIEQGAVVKPLAVEARDGAAVLVEAKPVVPEPEPRERSVFGNFILQPGAQSDSDKGPPRGGRLVSESMLRLKGVDGLTIRIRPHWIAANGRWTFSFVDDCVSRCSRTGDMFTLLLMGGGSSLPLSEANLGLYEEAAAKLGARYASNPLCAGVHVTGASDTGHSEELYWGRPMPPAAIAANKRMIDAWTKAFPAQVKLLAGSANDPAAMHELIKYGVAKTGGRFLYKNNAQSASTDLNWMGNQLVVWAGKNGAHIGWEAKGGTNDSRFGGTLQKMFDNIAVLTKQAGKQPGESYRAIYPYLPDLQKLGAIR